MLELQPLVTTHNISTDWLMVLTTADVEEDAVDDDGRTDAAIRTLERRQRRVGHRRHKSVDVVVDDVVERRRDASSDAGQDQYDAKRRHGLWL